MNEAMQNLLTRRSCRAYKPELIEEEITEFDRIPLARFERLVDYAVEGKFIVT